MNIEQLTARLNGGVPNDRLDALKKIIMHPDFVRVEAVAEYVNNHIHTIYSFSPYSPTMAAWMAYKAGLSTCGIMDHDSIAGATEFIEAGKILGIATTIGVEVRVDMSESVLTKKRINNPDQASIAYVALHGISHSCIDMVEDWLDQFRVKRNLRNRKMTDKVNSVMRKYGISIDFDRDVKSLSKCEENGSITERHLMYALAQAIVQKVGKGQGTIDFLTKLGAKINSKVGSNLADTSNINYYYDVLGVLKAELMSKFYIEATDECPTLESYFAIAKKCGGITAYAYLGDVTSSITDDKKAQTFEDSYLDELFTMIKIVGFDAVTYMPTRNSIEQLQKIQTMCTENNLFQISGEDINSPRQSFVIEVLKKPEFRLLIDSTWALINHEKRVTEDINEGLFSIKAKAKNPFIADRIKAFVQ